MKKSFIQTNEEGQRLLPPRPEASPSPSRQPLGSQAPPNLTVVDSDHLIELDQERQEEIPPPPPPLPPSHTNKISSLDFERVVNEYSIQATRDRFLLDEELEQRSAPGYGTTLSSQRSSPFFSFLSPKRKRKPRRNTGRTATRWFLSTAVGLLTGLTTSVIAGCTETIVAWRAGIMDEWARDDVEFFPLKRHYMFVLFTAVNLVMATVASALCVYWAPQGSGSGIPEYV